MNYEIPYPLIFIDHTHSKRSRISSMLSNICRLRRSHKPSMQILDLPEQASYQIPSPILLPTKGAQLRVVPWKNPSPAENLISHTATERTLLISSKDSSSSRNTPCHQFNSHEHDQTSYGHIIPSSNYPPTHYGYPETTISFNPQDYQRYQQA